MGKKNNSNIVWDMDEYEVHQKKYKKKIKPKKQGIQEEFDLTAWEQDKKKANNRRDNKYKDKEKYDKLDDKWN